MKQPVKSFFLLSITGLTLTACSTWMPQSQSNDVMVTHSPTNGEMGLMSGEPVQTKGTVGGSVATSMDSRDQARLSKGLDNALGKSSQWTNNQTGVKYTVTPTRKVTISGNPFCRSYNLTAEKGGSTQNMNGTACLGSDGAWHPV